VKRLLALSALSLAVTSLMACADDDPVDTAPRDGSGDGEGVTLLYLDDDHGAACETRATDYAPGGASSWEACDPDDGVYRRFEEQISSIGRIAAYEQIADLLVRNGAPSTADFIAARELYATDEGLDSRVQRREDEHYPQVTDAAGETLRCRDEGVPAMDPNRCVGPALILPILNAAFNAGVQGEDVVVNAARVDAALLWFMYVSTHKEATTCTVAKKDCDSNFAYFAGGGQRAESIGLAAAMERANPAAFERAWDGVLAVRCWRDLDDAEEATNLALRDQAIEQLDRGLLFGLTEMVVDRVYDWDRSTGADRAADAAWLDIMLGVLQREVTARGAVAGDIVATMSETVIAQDEIDALRALFPCP
jgi:hypothetical protein